MNVAQKWILSKKGHRPNYIYRYMSCSDLKRVEQLLCSHQLYFCRPSQFNDPFDCSPFVEELLSWKQEKRLHEIFAGGKLSRSQARRSKRLQSKHGLSIQDTIARSKDSFGVCCFTEEDKNLLMWSHYADSHKGICVQFCTNLPVWNPKWFTAPVSYASERPVLSVDDIGGQAWPLIEKTLLTKAQCWSYEREWRAVAKPEQGPGTYTIDGQVITGVILGACMQSHNELAVTELAEAQRIPVMKATLSEREFKLMIESP